MRFPVQDVGLPRHEFKGVNANPDDTVADRDQVGKVGVPYRPSRNPTQEVLTGHL
jgi:hypothetical protein